MVDTSGVLAGKTLAQISVGGADACAVDTAGAAYCWGRNYYGQLGDGQSGDTTSSAVPVAVDTSGVLAGKTLTQISTSGVDTCALDSAGNAYCWGDGLNGQLGNGASGDSAQFISVPVAVAGGYSFTQISVGIFQTCALTTADAAYCWGDDTDGELGNASAAPSSVPIPVDTSGVLAGVTLTQISAGFYFSCALGSTGDAYC